MGGSTASGQTYNFRVPLGCFVESGAALRFRLAYGDHCGITAW